MRPLLILILALVVNGGFAQTLSTFKDPSGLFTIGVPSGWQRSPHPIFPVYLSVTRKADSSGPVHESLSLEVRNKKSSSLDKEYQNLVASLAATNNFKLLDNGALSIHGQKFRWFVENQYNPYYTEEYIAKYVFVAYKEEKSYILSFTTLADDFGRYRSLFDKVAGTLGL